MSQLSFLKTFHIRVTQLAAASLFGLLAACGGGGGSDGALLAEPLRLPNAVEITVSTDPNVSALAATDASGPSGSSERRQALATVAPSVKTTGLDIRKVGATRTFDHDGMRYFFATIEVRNAQSCSSVGSCPAYTSPGQNLVLVALDTAATVGSTALRNLKNDAGGDASALATSFVPIDAMRAGANGGPPIPDSNQPTVRNYPLGERAVYPSSAGTTLDYGFIVNRPDTADSRSLPASPAANQFDGTTVIGFKVPLQPNGGTPKTFTITIHATEDINFSDYGTSPGPQGIAVGDLNGDGFQDIVTANYTASLDTVTVRLGNGNGGFNPGFDVSTGAGPRAVAIGDVNLDGIPDIVTANYLDDSISILLGVDSNADGKGDGSFNATAQPAIALADFAGPRAISVVTQNLGGVKTVHIATADFGNDTVSLVRFDADGISAPISLAVGFKPSGVALGDLNGDGRLDIVASNEGDDTVSVYRQGASGNFFATLSSGVPLGPLALDAAANPRSIVLADVNGDGRLDILTANSITDQVALFLGNGNATFGARTDIAVPGTLAGNASTPYSVAVGDFNGDGKQDLLTANFDDFSTSFLSGNGVGGFAFVRNYKVGSKPYAVLAQDLNGDGKADAIVTNSGPRDAGDNNVIDESDYGSGNSVSVVRGR